MERLKIGWGKREITIRNENVSLQGQVYCRIAEDVLDPVYTTALCLQSGEGVIIFCSCDLPSIRNGISTDIVEEIKKINPEIPTEHIIFNATHTHTSLDYRDTPKTSPDGVEIYPGYKVKAHIAHLAAEAIVEAWENRKEGGMAFGYGYAVVGHSRRTRYLVDKGKGNPLAVAPNGYAAMYGKTNDPDFAGYEAGADHFLNLMFTFDANDKLTGMVVNVPCPSQIGEHLVRISADYWNEVRNNVKEEYGEDVYVLAQCAAAGDLSPRLLHYKDAQIRRMTLKYGMGYDPEKISDKKGKDYFNKIMSERLDVAERILNGIRDVYPWAKKDIQKEVPVTHICREVKLTKRQITEADIDRCKNNLIAIEDAIKNVQNNSPEEYRVLKSRLNTIRAKNAGAIERYEELQKEPYLTTKIHTVRVGEIAFATTRFELYMDYMHRIQARSPFIQTFLIQLAGDELGSYLPTKQGVEGLGYSASIFCNKVGPEGGQEYVENIVEMLGEMENN